MTELRPISKRNRQNTRAARCKIAARGFLPRNNMRHTKPV
nr:MAG TPA: hypothetical protein [Bacteriophage sp.]